MSKAGGLVLILSGLGVAGYGISQSSDLRQQFHVGKIMEAPANHALLVSEALPTLSPAEVVIVTPRSGALPTPPQRLAIPSDRETLVRELQKELRRVGCYDGEVTGAWSPSTRRAMKAFIERMNASLPVEKPDAFLYAMVQDQRDQVCGKACPIGEDLSVNGRCVPAVILGKANRKVTPISAIVAATGPKVNVAQEEKPPAVATGWSITNVPLAAPSSLTGGPFKTMSPPVDGRMALAGPTPEPAPTTDLQARRSNPKQTITRPIPPRAAAGGQRWSRAIFSPRTSNN